MKRVENWEARLKKVIQKHHRLPSEYGISDCYLIVDDTVEAVTGERMFPDIIYSTKLEAAKLLLQHGFSNVEDAFASKFPMVHPALAQRGDIGVTINTDGEICGGFFCSLGFAVRDNISLLFMPVSIVKTAFKVGR